MNTERRVNLRAIVVLVGCTLLIVSAVFWWAPWEPPVAGPEVQTDASPDASKPNLKNATSNPATVTEPTSAPEEDDSLPRRVTAEEIQKVKGSLSAARQLLRDIEAKHVTPVMVTDNEGWRNEHVHLPALTREQLDPVYTQLSEAGRDFPERSGAAKMHRQEADKFLDSLRQLPAKHASRNLDKKTGLVSYGVTLLLENATVTKGGGGSLEIQGAAMSSNQNAKPEEVSHLFRDEPK